MAQIARPSRTAARPGCTPTCGPWRTAPSPCGRNCWRWRTVSPTPSSSSAIEPPTWRWMLTAHHHELEVDRAEPLGHAPRMASSFGRPRRTSLATRPNSLAGRARRPRGCRLHRLVQRVAGLQRRRHRDEVSGSWSSNAFRRLRAFSFSHSTGQEEAEREQQQREQREDARQPGRRGQHAARRRASCRTARRSSAAGRRARSAAPCSSRPEPAEHLLRRRARGARACATRSFELLVRACACARTRCRARAAATASRCGRGRRSA